MTGWTRGLALAGLHLALVASLGGKLLWDRSTRPRVWARTAPVDPKLPLRGRYLSLRLDVPLMGLPPAPPKPVETKTAYRPPRYVQVQLVPDASLLRATYLTEGVGRWETGRGQEGGTVEMIEGQTFVRLHEPVLFFIPDTAQDPSFRPREDELWVEVTLPKAGPPRPIRLGIRRGGILAVWNPRP